ncbi:MAG TPA: hypothetical protein VNM67_21660 [Thermoanaerobaculia bacterium]|jgi:hypothetical protein|nr:hypothetical protein [Thermoanaerobaculia bacterium]
MRKSSNSFEKRRKELARKEKQREKAERREQREREKATRAPGSEGEDPDIAGIVPGPQPRDEEDEA